MKKFAYTLLYFNGNNQLCVDFHKEKLPVNPKPRSKAYNHEYYIMLKKWRDDLIKIKLTKEEKEKVIKYLLKNPTLWCFEMNISLKEAIDEGFDFSFLGLRNNKVVFIKAKDKTKGFIKPKMDQSIYVPSSFYVYRGEDDFAGGLATINKIEYSSHLPEDHVNYIMVGIKERPESLYNWKNLLKDQEKLAKEFKNAKAQPDPDYSPQFNNPNEGWK